MASTLQQSTPMPEGTPQTSLPPELSVLAEVLDMPDLTEEPLPEIKPQSEYFKNLTDKLTLDDQKKLSEICLNQFKSDKSSRSLWEKRYENWLRLLSCQPLQDTKTEPFHGASNVLLPVLTIACVQFWARAIDAIYPSKNIVNAVPTGDGQDELERANRVSKHMSYQIQYKMPNFYTGLSTSLMQLPMSGTVVRKTYYDPQLKTNVSEFIDAKDFVVNYYTRYLNKTTCVTHVFYESYNDMLIKQQAGIYSNVDESLRNSSATQSGNQPDISSDIENRESKNQGVEKPREDIFYQRTVLEMHITVPIFDDTEKSIVDQPGNIAKRYLITIDKESGKILRIVDPTYIDEETHEVHEMEYFTKYGFIPSPDGSFYSIGFGLLLEAANETVNTIINQLIDAGHLANTQSGVINKRSGMKRGQLKLRRGEFAEVELNTDDIRKAIMPLTFSPPSQVLFQLLGTLQDYADRVTTVSDVFTGEMPRSDTSATAITTTVEQGLKVFSAIYKSLHMSFGDELKKLFVLNSIYFDAEEYFDIVVDDEVLKPLGEPPKWIKEAITKEDYLGLRDVMPASDPNATSKMERTQKAQAVYMTVTQNPVAAQNSEVMVMALREYLLSITESTAQVKAIIDPLLQMIEMQKQQQAIQQQQMAQQQEALKQNEQAMQMKAHALGMHQRQLEEGHIPTEIAQGLIHDATNIQNTQGAPQPQAVSQ